MRCPIVVFAILCVGVVSQTLAADPPQPAAQPTVVSTPASTTTGNSPTASVANAAEAVKDVSEEQAKRLRMRGYRPEVRNGVTLFCRKEAPLGSRFESKICGTAANLDKATTDGKDLTQGVQRDRGNPATK